MDLELFLATITVDHFPFFVRARELLVRGGRFLRQALASCCIALVPPPRHQHPRCFHYSSMQEIFVIIVLHCILATITLTSAKRFICSVVTIIRTITDTIVADARSTAVAVQIRTIVHSVGAGYEKKCGGAIDFQKNCNHANTKTAHTHGE